MSSLQHVQYIDVGGTVRVGESAMVKPYDHPNDRLNRQWTRTTSVVQVIEGAHGPVFRTHNTVYRPMDGYEPMAVGEVQFRDYSQTPFKQLPSEVSV